jgi:hypothetical protein
MRCDSAARRLIAGLGAVLVLVGCTHVHPVNLAAPGADIDQVNRQLADREARVSLVDHAAVVARDVSVSADSVFIQAHMLGHASWWLGSASAVPISEVRSIEVTRRGRGARDGALLGLGLGVAAGAAIGVIVFEASSGESEMWSRGVSAFVCSMIGGVLGTGFGLLVGANTGSIDVYDLTGASGATGSPSPGQ